ncbi:MAG: sulfatase-like hydrolase/transferase, partial [Thermodesulfobacteriota bacterium]
MRPQEILKPASTALLLILILETIQILSKTNYYPHHNTLIATFTSVALVMAFFFVFLFIFSILASLATSRHARCAEGLLAIVETISIAALALIFVPAAILVVKKNSPETIKLFWHTGYGLFPIIIFLSVVILRIVFKKRFKAVLYNLVDIFWRPAFAVAAISIVWAAVFLATGGAGSAGGSAGTKGVGETKSLTSSSKRDGKAKPNVILITFDALSASDMSLYGYERDTTPFFEELAKESYLFKNMHSNYNNTAPALSSMLTSKYPWSHGVRKWLDSIDKDRDENIIAPLKDEYYTAAIFPSAHHNPEFLGLQGEFDYSDWVWFEFPLLPGLFEAVSNAGISSYAIPIIRHLVFLTNYYPLAAYDGPFLEAGKFLSETKERPLFLWIHLWPPHSPYLPPAPFKGLYLPVSEEVDNDIRGWYDMKDAHMKREVEKLRARYDEYIRYADSALGTFVSSLKRMGYYDDSIIIVSSDHGQNHDKGYARISAPLMNESKFHIPFLIHFPGQREGVSVRALAEQVDIGPTLMELTGRPIPAWMEGESLVPYMKEPSLNTKKVKYSMTFFQLEKEFRWFAAYLDDFKLIYHLGVDDSVLFKVENGKEIDEDLKMIEPQVHSKLLKELKAMIEENYDDLS